MDAKALDAQPAGPKRVLIVDDEEPILRALRRVFQGDYEVHQTSDSRQALELARAISPHVVIADQTLPLMSGVEILAQVREEMPGALRVLITGNTDYNSLVDAVNSAQVHHYFEKPFHSLNLKNVVDVLLRTHTLEEDRDRIAASLKLSVEQLERANKLLSKNESLLQHELLAATRDLSNANESLLTANRQLELANRQLRELTVRDGLTGLFNYRYMMEHANIEIARSQRYKRVFSLLFLDIDNFKKINDSLGHAVGDKVLCQVAAFLRPSQEGLRRSDFSARYGGEEFCVLLPETPLNGGAIKARRLRKQIADFDWSSVDAGLTTVTASFGVAAFPDHAETLEKLIETADAAQYAAKRQGKDRVVVAGAETR